MSRLVEPRDRGAHAFSREATPKNLADYLERVALYVPSEILAAYLFLLPIVRGTTEAGSGLRLGLLAVVLIGLASLTVPYLAWMAEEGQPKRTHIRVAVLAYLVWTYSIGGFWTELGLYHEAVASILVVFFSIGSGFVIPHKGDK